MEMSAKTKKAMVLINLIKDYRELALTARDCGEFFGNMMGIDWELGDGDRSEWDQRKGDDIYQVAYEYEEQVVKLKRRLLDLVESSDEPLSVPINWRDVGILRYPIP